jgi:uncharacterized protein YlxW (UPF0749 family)
MTKRPPWVLVAVLTLVGFLLVVTGTATSAANKTEAPRQKELIAQILQQRSNVDDLNKAVNEVRGEVSTAEAQAGAASASQEQQNQKLAELQLQAGTSAVKGPGVEVKLSDAPQSGNQSDASFTANRIQDSDIQLIVNALFASGAEAVSVNGNRVVAVTPIRAAGGTIVVNYQPVNSPYTITAIGADQKHFMSTDIAQHFQQWKQKFKLGFSVQKHGNISIPAYSGRVSIDQAQAIPPTTTSTTSTTLTTTTTRK